MTLYHWFKTQNIIIPSQVYAEISAVKRVANTRFVRIPSDFKSHPNNNEQRITSISRRKWLEKSKSTDSEKTCSLFVFRKRLISIKYVCTKARLFHAYIRNTVLFRVRSKDKKCKCKDRSV